MQSFLLLLFMTIPNFLLAQDLPLYAGCKDSDFVLIETDEVVVKVQGMSFVPKCLRVKEGTKVILPGSKNHPLGGAAEIEGIFNPFAFETPHTTNQERVLSEQGLIGFNCVRHSDPITGTGMAGLIEVVERYPDFAGCKEEDFVFVDADVVDVKVSGLNYSPKCLRVKAGTKVNLPGSSFHPLEGASEIEGLLNPFTTGASGHLAVASAELVDQGFYGYLCLRHSDPVTGSGMAGMIQVIENFPDYAGCKDEDYVFVSGAEVEVKIQGQTYIPRCLKVKAGTSIILPASSHHPLQAGPDFNLQSNPFRTLDDGHEVTQKRILSSPGFFGYHCLQHADAQTGNGMGGMIKVIK